MRYLSKFNIAKLFLSFFENQLGADNTIEEDDGDIDDDFGSDSDVDSENMDEDENHSSGNSDKKQTLSNRFQMNQYNFSTLSSWYESQCKCNDKKKPVIIIIPDFESFTPKILGELILLLR